MFKCKHPFNMLAVMKEAIKENIDSDFDRVVYHLYCLRCSEALTISHATMIGGIKEFMGREEQRKKKHKKCKACNDALTTG